MQTFFTSLKLLEVQTEVLLAIGEVLDAEQLHGFLGGLGVVGISVMERQLGEGGLGWKEQPVAEGELGIDVVPKNDLRYLEGKQGVEITHLLRAIGGDDGGGVDEAFRDQDRIADRDGFQRIGEEGPDADRAIDGDLVVGENVVGELCEDLVEIARGVDEAGGV